MGGAGGDEPPPPPGAGKPPPSRRGPKRGFRDQFWATVFAAQRLVTAHIELAKAELADILEGIGRVAALFGAAVALAIFAVILVTVGSSLFVGEWLFGSMGWGIMLFTELAAAIGLVLVLIALDIPVGHLGRGLLVSAVLGLLVTLLAGFLVFNRLWEAIGLAVAPNLEPATAPLVVGTVIGAAIGAVVGLFGGTQTGGGRSVGQVIKSAIGGLFLGGIIGAALGAFSSITFAWNVAVALGIAILLGAWIALCALEATRAEIEAGQWARKFYPSKSIDSAKETIEWVRERAPLKPKS